MRKREPGSGSRNGLSRIATARTPSPEGATLAGRIVVALRSSFPFKKENPPLFEPRRAFRVKLYYGVAWGIRVKFPDPTVSLVYVPVVVVANARLMVLVAVSSLWW